MADNSTIRGTCFFIAPIGNEGSEIRTRSDKVLKHLVRPAAKRCGFRAIRGDQISEPGVINGQVIRHIAEDPVVVADLTGANGNVFYELALRHVLGRPCVQIIEKGERIPFDVTGMRTVEVDMRDPDSLEAAREEVVRQMRAATEKGYKVENPVSQAITLPQTPDIKGCESLGNGCPLGSVYYGSGKTARSGDVFQDFRILQKVKRGNINAVQYMWADARAGNTIHARIVDSTLRVYFETANGSYPPTIAIRGKDESPLMNVPCRKYLAFGVRTCGDDKRPVSPCTISVRVVNGHLQHWVYGSRDSGPVWENVERNAWKTVKIDLSSQAWHRFKSDGNPAGPPDASFECVCAVILEIRSQEVRGTDEKETGEIEISQMVLLDDEKEYSSYLPGETAG